jgi:hypothetical protein
LRTMHYLHILLPVISLVINAICQIGYCRCFTDRGLLKSVFAGFIAGMFTLLCIEWYYLTQLPTPLFDNIASASVNVIAYSALGYCYFHFINLSETGRRIRILMELADSKNGLFLDEILQRYDAKEIITNRLGRLLKNGQILYKNNRYHIGKPLMLFMSRAVIFLKLFILGKESEFD